MSPHDADSMQLHENLEEWDLLNRFAAWTGYFSTLLFVASTAAMLVAFASGQVG